MKRAFAILSCLLLLSCDKELDLDIDFEGKKLAISCLINPYDSVSVSIERTNDPNLGIEQRLLITSAHIVLIEDGVELTDFAYDSVSGAFVSDYLPRVGPEYQLIVEVSGYEPVVSEVISIPESVDVRLRKTETEVVGQNDTIVTENGTSIRYDMMKTASLLINFEDRGDEHNFYATRLDYEYLVFAGGFAWSSRLGGIYSENCDFTNAGGWIPVYYFDDFCFDGIKPTVQFDVSFGLGTMNLHVTLYSLEKNAYNYLKQLGLYKIALYQTELNLDPVRIPSSFENAYGVFGAYNYSVSTILFE